MQPCFSLCHPFSVWIGQRGGCIQGCTVMGFPSPTVSSLCLLSYLWKASFYAKPSSDFSLITVGEHQPAFPVDSLPYLVLPSREHVEAFIPERIPCQVLYKYQLHAAEPEREYSLSFSSERGASLGVCQPGSWECNLKSSQEEWQDESWWFVLCRSSEMFFSGLKIGKLPARFPLAAAWGTNIQGY